MHMKECDLQTKQKKTTFQTWKTEAAQANEKDTQKVPKQQQQK